MISPETLERWKLLHAAHPWQAELIQAVPILIAEIEEQGGEMRKMEKALRTALRFLRAYQDDRPEDFGASAHDVLWAVEAALKETP